MSWSEYLDSLEVWAVNNGYCVIFDKDLESCICYKSRIIEINASYSKKEQVMSMLHECGHALIFENGSSVYDFEKFEGLKEKTVASKVFEVIEEIEAWKRGKELARRLRIPIDDVSWDRTMAEAIKKYIDLAAD